MSDDPETAPAFLFDLDGTLVDSVYQHVLAWREALEQAGIELSVWRIHRRIGMSGGLFVNALLREIGRKVTAEQVARILKLHAEAYGRVVAQVRPLPGARDLLAYLSRRGVPWAIATSGLLESARPALEMLGAGPEVPVITRDQVRHAKPDPDLFLAAAARLGVDVRASVVVGDSVYQHVLAWREALESVGIELSVWRIHRRIGMSGGLFVHGLFRETGRELKPEQAAQIRRVHAEAYARQVSQVRPLPGARELLAYLTKAGVPWAIGTSGRMESAKPNLDMLGIPAGVPIVTRDQVEHAKPDPDLFLAGAQRLGVPIGESVVVGDSVWDLLAARRARALGVGLLSGGYGEEELERAGAYRVFADPAAMLHHLDELGVRA